MKKELFVHQDTISILSQEKVAQIKFYKTHKDKEIDKVIALENKVMVLDNIVYKTGQIVQTMNMLNRNCKTSFSKPEFLKKAQRANPRLYDIEQADWKDDTDDKPEDHELEAHYMYMAQIQEVTSDTADNSRPIFDTEPLENVSNNYNYNVFAIESENPKKSKSVHDTYPIEQDEHNVIIDSLDMSYDLANEALVDKLKGQIEDFKTKNKSLESSNNHFKEVNNELSRTNQLMYKDLKKFQAELDRYNDVKYASKVEIDCAKAKGDLMSYKMESKKSFNAYTRNINDLNQTISEMKKELSAHQETISIMSQQKEAHLKFYKTHEDKEIDKVVVLENKIKDLDNIVYKTGQSVQTMNMLNRNCKTSFAKPEFLKKAQRENPRLYDIGCYNDNLALMLAPESDENVKSRLHKDIFQKEKFHLCLKEKKVADLRYFNSLELEVDPLKSQLETQKTQFLNEIDRLSREDYYVDHMNAILGVIPSTSVNRPQLKSNQIKDRVMLNYSQGKKQEVEDHRRNVKFSKNKTFITACNDNFNAKTSNVNFVYVTCGKCVLNDKHDMCDLHSRNGVNSRTKMPMAVPISTREPKRIVNQSVAKPLRKTVALESTNQKPRHTTRKLYENVSKTCSWWYPKYTPPRYKWKSKSQIGNVNLNLVEIILFIVDSGCSKHMTGNLKLLTNFVEKFLGTVKFGNDQISPILGYGDLSTCYIRVLKRNNLLTSSRGTYLYSITLQDTSSPNLICLMAKATSSQAWLWHRRLSHLNFDTINLLSKNDIMIGLPQLKFIKYHLCSSCKLGKAKRKSFQTKSTPSSKRRLQLLHMDLWGPMPVESINGKKYVLVIVYDYSRFTWTHFLRSKDETPEVLIDFLRLVQRGIHAQVRIVRTDKGMELLNKTPHEYFASDEINH
nr:hypothetical protein [Tanacetum cinerariifolium]